MVVTYYSTKMTNYVKGNIEYHPALKAGIWDENKQLVPEVNLRLLEIAQAFIGYLDIPDFKVIDVILTGSMANYNYTRYSDFDLHVVTDYDDLEADNIVEAFYRAKKEIWNNQHDIKIKGHEVELYVEDEKVPPTAGGMYSLIRSEWVKQPEHNEPAIDERSINAKSKDLIRQIDRAIKSKSIEDIKRLKDKIRILRRSGLASVGEFGVENLAFKIIRNLGYLDKLNDAYLEYQDRAMSLEGRYTDYQIAIMEGGHSLELNEGTLSVDVPNEAWLQDKIDYAKSKGRNSFGVPYMGSTTAHVRGTPPRVRVLRLASLPGMRNEQTNVRKDDLKWLMDYMDTHKKLPPMGSNPDEEYLPYIMVAYNGEAWVNEGNHRIMAAYRLNWPDMPVEIRYFDGGERIKTGPMYPGKIGLGEVETPKSESVAEVFEPGKQNWKWRRQSSDEAFASFVVGDREYQWHAFSSEANPAKWEIQFRLIREKTDPDGLDLFGQTGTGNSAQVLSTAVDITRAFLQTYGLDKVEEITFNAKEDSRINLYAKMIKRLLPNWDLSSRKSLSYGMQFTLTDPRAYDKPENKITEIERMASNEYSGGKKSLRVGQGKKEMKKLPGNNAFMYSIEPNQFENGIIIKLWDSAKQTAKPVQMKDEDGEEFSWRLRDWERTQGDDIPGVLVGKLVLEDVEHFPIKGAVQVDTITVDEDYRSQGVAKSLYGVVLSILKKPLIAGSSQTPGGRRNWVSLSQIPGVDVKGYVMINESRFDNPNSSQDIDVIMGKLGGQYIGQSSPAGIHYFAFDVLPGSGELAPAIKSKLSQIYNETSSKTGLYAIWSGSVNEAETGTEYADQVDKEFKALGYKQIGSGADSTVWAKDQGHIIKILMPEDTNSQAERVFTKFYEFCEAHQDLTCLPVINEHNTIDVLGKEYTQIDMERLYPVKKNSFNEGVVWFFSDFVAGEETWDAVDHALGLAETWREYNPRQAVKLAAYWQDLSMTESNTQKLKELHTLYGVMQILYTTGRINKFGWDLHTENVMQRKNGQLVIIDPWFAQSTLSESANVVEARTNPEQNTRHESGFKELQAVAKTLGDTKNWAISMTSEPKLGINPQVGISEDTPKGIYFYPLNYALDKTRYGKLPWGHDYPYIQLFQYDRSGEMTKKTKVDPAQLKQALSQYCSEEVIQQAIDEPEYDGTPYWFIYDCLSRLGKGDETNVVRWNKVLRDLGFTSVYDDGAGWIAYNEPTQGVVLDPRVIKQLKTIVNKKQSGVVTPAKIEQTIFETMDMELARNRAWQAYDPDGTKLRAAAKEYAKDPKFKPYFGKPGTEEIYDKAASWGRYGARQLSDIAYEWYKQQQAQKTESITEGGWASAATQNTTITPKIVVEIVNNLGIFAHEYNYWQAQLGLDTEIKMGRPKGSGTYYERDLAQDPEREYGDVDIECFIHSREGASSAQRITEYKQAIKDFTQSNKDYSTDNGTNVIVNTSAGPVQVDLIFTYHEHADWSRALSPEYRVKGVISTSLTSSLAEVLNLSFSSQGIQAKLRNGAPVSFRQSKDTVLQTVSTNPEKWAVDIYKFFYELQYGTEPESITAELSKHSGLKDEQRLSDIVLTIKSLASAFEESSMLGQGALAHISNKDALMRDVARVYDKKLTTAENSSKFDKAATPAAVEKAGKTKLMMAKYRNEIAKLLLN